MPLLSRSVVNGAATKEFPIIVGCGPIHGHLENLKQSFPIPEGVLVDGMVLPFQLHDLYANNIFPAAEEKGIQFQDVNIVKQLEICLPSVFNPGTLTLSPGENGEVGKHQAVFVYEDNTIPIVRYKTQKPRGESVEAMLNNLTLLAVIPKEILQEVKDNKPIMIIPGKFSTELHEYDNYIFGQPLKLVWNEKESIVETSVIIYSPSERKEITNDITKTYFVLEESTKPREYDENNGPFAKAQLESVLD